MGDEISETFEIIRLDGSDNKGKMHYFNSKGENGFMTSSLVENNFNIEGESLKFEGTIDNENTQVVGKWYSQTKNNEWINSIDLKLTRQK